MGSGGPAENRTFQHAPESRSQFFAEFTLGARPTMTHFIGEPSRMSARKVHTGSEAPLINQKPAHVCSFLRTNMIPTASAPGGELLRMPF